MQDCGIKYQKDWLREKGDNPLDYSIFWLEPEDGVFNEPNKVEALISPSIYWVGDIGDRLQYGTGGDARLIAGIHIDQKSSDAVIASCMQGRVIFQTFSTHDYKESQMVPLWENYMYNALKNRYLSAGN
jgi:hypothetical protein